MRCPHIHCEYFYKCSLSGAEEGRMSRVSTREFTPILGLKVLPGPDKFKAIIACASCQTVDHDQTTLDAAKALLNLVEKERREAADGAET